MPMNLAIDNEGVMTLMGQTVRRDIASNKASVLDVIQIITGQPSNRTSQTLSRLLGQYQELMARCHYIRINGSGRKTPVADAPTLVELVLLVRKSMSGMLGNFPHQTLAMQCPGRQAAAVRSVVARTICRLLQQDEGLVAEVEARHRANAGSLLAVTASYIQQWQQEADPVQPRVAGMVYIVTSPLLAAVKIGFWTRSESRLMQRFRCDYGAQTQMVTKMVSDAKRGESIMHDLFADRRLCNELFNKQGWPDYAAALQLL